MADYSDAYTQLSPMGVMGMQYSFVAKNEADPALAVIEELSFVTPLCLELSISGDSSLESSLTIPIIGD